MEDNKKQLRTANNKEKKGKKKSPNLIAQERLKKHEPIILDLIQGIGSVELSRKYGKTCDTINKIYRKNEERIQRERNAILEAKEQAIRDALQEERERIGRLVNKSGRLMEMALDGAIELFESGGMETVEQIYETGPEGGKTKTKQRPVTLDAVQSLFKDVRSILLQYQKESDDAANP